MTFPAPKSFLTSGAPVAGGASARDPSLSRRSFLASIGVAGALPAGLLGCESAPIEPQSGPRPAPWPKVVAVPTMDGRGARVRRIFPTQRTGYQDPFVLLDDFLVGAPAGFPDHPHRGFEAFTYMIDGSFHHKDNMGNDSVVHTGGTQRFTSGKGARHSEMPVGTGENRGLQLWVNLPRSQKQIAPEYEAVHGRDLPEEGRNGAVVRTIVGKASPVKLRTAVTYLHVRLPAGARFEEAIPPGHAGLVYIAEGRARLNDADLPAGEGVLPPAGEVGLLASADTHAFFLIGNPHQEPILHHGPFVD